MLITVKVSSEELKEMGLNSSELKSMIIVDLESSDIDGDYVGFDVVVELEGV